MIVQKKERAPDLTVIEKDLRDREAWKALGN
jgi:hypothetical protein